MRAPIRVLVVAPDASACADLVAEHLKRVELGTIPSFAASEGEYSRQLMVGVDVVVWQHGHAGVSAGRALAIPHVRNLDVPVLILAGAADDQTILEYIRLGATEVLQQDTLMRLGAVVERALTERDLRIAQRRTDAALRYSETRFRMIASMISDFAYVLRVIDSDTLAWEWTSDAPTGIGDLQLSELPDRDGWTELVHPDDRHIVESHYATLRTGGSSEVEFRIGTADGSIRHLRDHARAEPDHWSLLIYGSVKDVTEHKRNGEALRASEARYRRIVETSHEGILMSDAEQRITFANRRIVEMFGWSLDEIMGQPILNFVTPEERAETQRRFDAGRTSSGDRQQYGVKLKRKDGSAIWIVVSASTMFGANGEYQGRLAMIADVTERKRAEEELFQAQKLESVGRLAAGIAHEINTPIQFIGDNVHFLRDSFHEVERVITAARALADVLDQGKPTTKSLDELREAEDSADLEYLSVEVPRAVEQTLDGVERVATIVRAMKEFAHPDHQERTAVDLNQALSSTLIVARSEVKYVADVETEYGDLPPVTCHPSAVNQVFLNLLVNAAHAVTDQAGSGGERGKIVVRTRTEGKHAVIEVEDNGCGIPEEIAAKVFDQFFTTKAVGRGTGQGLALARRVITDQHGGSLTFSSVVGRGTTFSVRLPLNGPGDVQIAGQEARSA